MTYVLVAAVIAVVVFMFIFGRGGVSSCKKLPRLIMYKLIYSDTHSGTKGEEDVYRGILYSPKYDLQGKPDMIYRHRLTGNIIIVEIKSGNCDWPHEGDMLQVGTYMLIVEDIYLKRPKKAYILYKNNCFVVRNIHSLRNDVLDTAQRMRDMLITGEEEPNARFANCRHCVCDGTVCEFSQGE